MFMIATIQSDRERDPDPSGSVWMPMNGNVKRSTQIPNPVATPAAASWPPSFAEPRQAAEVVDDPDGDGDGGAEQQPEVLAPE